MSDLPALPDPQEGRKLLSRERIRGLRAGVNAALDRAQTRCIVRAEMRLDARIVAALLDATEAVERVRDLPERARPLPSQPDRYGTGWADAIRAVARALDGLS